MRSQKDILLFTPPFTQLNTPYPATSYLKGFLNTKNISSFQFDLGIEVINEMFSKNGLERIFEQVVTNNISENATRIFALRETYIATIEDVIGFLQGKNATLANEICSGTFLPQAARFNSVDDIEWAFGTMGFMDKAKHLATLYLEDISDFIKECVDDNFGFSRYAEQLARSANSFAELETALAKPLSMIDNHANELVKQKIDSYNPKLICISVPFPGNLFSAFRCAEFIKKNYPDIKIALGGGFVNTELRTINEIKVFNYFDFICLDKGELPIELIYQNINVENPTLKRTFVKIDNKVFFNDLNITKDYDQISCGTPDYSDLLLDKYISVIEIANPMHSLWSNGRWNKLTLAHGCYWAKCTFCDVSLSYIKDYEPIVAKVLVDRIEEIIKTTGEKGFHFVDEAAPPFLMRDLALELLRRKINITWWTNIRFEKNFSYDLCKLLKASGCIAVSGGLEVASDRLLDLIKKGVTVPQVAKVCHNFTDAGIMVHAYLMYAFPSQTIQETIDSLEMVKQMFEHGIIQSGFWHHFALTAHSPIGLQPENYGLKPDLKKIEFANNDIEFKDVTDINHDKFSFGLRKSLYNYMHGIGFDFNLQEWFDFKIPKTSIKPNYIENCLNENDDFTIKENKKVVWLGNKTNDILVNEKNKKGKVNLVFQCKIDRFEITIDENKQEWLLNMLHNTHYSKNELQRLKNIKNDYNNAFDDFNVFWFSKPIITLKDNGLIEI